MIWRTFSILLSTFSGVGDSAPLEVGRKLIDSSSTYVSVQSGRRGIRSLIYVKGQNFNLRAVGSDRNTGRGSHEGGLITVEEYEDYFRLKNIGIVIPKSASSVFKFKDFDCETLKVGVGLFRTTCRSELSSKMLRYLTSKENGVVSFTGLCYLNAERLCDYVLVSETGIAVNGLPATQ